MTERISECLLIAGLDSLIVSIDGYKYETEASIRKGSNLYRIIKNIDNFIDIRERVNIKTKIIIRFTRQSANKYEWLDFYNFWKIRLNKRYSDSIFML